MEKRIENKLRLKVKALGGMALKLIALSLSGFPDRTVLMPKGKIYFVELKNKGKKPSPIQLLVHSMLRKLGFKVYVIDTDELLDEFIKFIVYEQNT